MAQAMVEGLKGKALPCPIAHASAALTLESRTPPLHSELGVASLSPSEFSLNVQIQKLRPKELVHSTNTS